jgi:thymidylate synthase ThyX
MQITQFEATGMANVAAVLEKFSVESISETTLRGLLKLCNVSFVLENINRLQSTLICELRDSYVQQSQRYVAIGNEACTLPNLAAGDKKRAAGLMAELFSLYEEMTVKKAGEFKGRPKKEQYVHGILIEDARYILPLAVRTNVSTAMSGDKLVDFYKLCADRRYDEILAKPLAELLKNLPKALVRALQNLAEDESSADLKNAVYEPLFDRISDEENLVEIDRFKKLDQKAALGALTSTNAKTPSEVLKGWADAADEKAAGVVRRVMGYGHTSIAEQSRTTFGMMMSLAAYHQQLRHRLTANVREELSALIVSPHAPKIPPDIKDSVFAPRFEALCRKTAAFRQEIAKKYGAQAALYFLLNCDQIKLLTAANARADAAMLGERTCMNAQWEIRELAVKKVQALRRLSPLLYEAALPSCVSGKCREGALSCGRAAEVREMFTEDKGEENG